MNAREIVDGLPPVLGGFDLTDQTRFAEGTPYELFARLRVAAPVLWHPPGRSADGESFWVLTRHEDIAAVAADPVFSAEGGGGRAGGGNHLDDLPMGVIPGVMIAMMDDPRHDVIRRLLAPSVTGRAVTALRGDLRAMANELVAPFVGAGPVNFVDDVSHPFAVQAMAVLLGVPEADWGRLRDWSHHALGFLNRRTGEADAKSAEIFGAMREYFGGLLAAKRAAPGPDLGSVLAAGDPPPGQPPLSDAEREVNANVLMVTGLEQPRNTIAGAVRAFAEHPDQWRLLREHRELLPSAIEEVLRWNPPNPYNRRTATRDVVLRGNLIRAGQKVTLWWPSANRDEAVFTDPDTFDIRRDPNPHLSFGHGAHFCLGDEVGKLEIALVLEALLDRVREIRPAGPVVWGASNKHTIPLDVPVELLPE
ncbi:cytochrome P450 [Saccharothrix obliqua]|uniref:cytochrome P450 n=1 Tax=Saccharothrix obliqua TaxID=2861747 RepID=UPI0027E32F39|nr:cytochrome P450 [Saccharothrix obliqua]